MSRALLGGLGGSCDDHEKTETDYFGYFTQSVKELLFNDEDNLHTKSELPGRKHGEERKTPRYYDQNYKGSLCDNGIGAGLSNFKMEKLESLVRESVHVFSSEVNEVLDSVEAMCKLRSRLGSKISWYTAATSDSHSGEVPHKKPKVTSPSCSSSFPDHSHESDGPITKEVSANKCVNIIHSGADLKNHGQGHKKKLLGCGDGSEKTKIQGANLQLDSKTNSEESEQVDDDVSFLLGSDSWQVKETVKKYSDELSSKLLYMEQQLELLLDALTSTCRPMTLSEKQQLQKLIQRLPPINLDRVVEIIGRKKQVGRESCNEIFVDLEKQDNLTLWRLHYYVKTVENAKKLACRKNAAGSSLMP